MIHGTGDGLDTSTTCRALASAAARSPSSRARSAAFRSRSAIWLSSAAIRVSIAPRSSVSGSSSRNER
jgi:hypothetical protein